MTEENTSNRWHLGQSAKDEMQWTIVEALNALTAVSLTVAERSIAEDLQAGPPEDAPDQVKANWGSLNNAALSWVRQEILLLEDAGNGYKPTAAPAAFDVLRPLVMYAVQEAARSIRGEAMKAEAAAILELDASDG